MKIRFWSDLHMDGAAFRFDENCPDEVLVLAGDTANSPAGLVIAMKYFSTQFRHIVVIPGNHEYYRGHPVSSLGCEISQLLQDNNLENVTFLDGNIHQIDNVKFYGATLWTNFRDFNHDTIEHSCKYINDFRLMYTHRDAKVSPMWMSKRNAQDLFLIKNSLSLPRMEGEKRVVITHFPPLKEFQHPRWGDISVNPLNGYFINDHADYIKDLDFDIWACGHTHDGSDFEKWGKRFICNPRGYAYRGVNENTVFNRDLVVEV